MAGDPADLIAGAGLWAPGPPPNAAAVIGAGGGEGADGLQVRPMLGGDDEQVFEVVAVGDPLRERDLCNVWNERHGGVEAKRDREGDRR